MRGRSTGRGRWAVFVAVVAVVATSMGTACSAVSGRSATVERPAADPPVLDLAAPTVGSVAGDGSVDVDDSTVTDPAANDAAEQSGSVHRSASDGLSAPAFDLAPPQSDTERIPATGHGSDGSPTEPLAPDGFDTPMNGAALVHRLDGERLTVASSAARTVPAEWLGRLPGWQIRFVQGRAGHRGITFPDSKVIEVYVRPGDDESIVAHVYAHEVAHALDVTRLSDIGRSSWAMARGFTPQRPWWAGDRAMDFETGSGDLAESFAWVMTGQRHWHGRLGGPPDAAQTLLMLALLSGG